MIKKYLIVYILTFYSQILFSQWFQEANLTALYGPGIQYSNIYTVDSQTVWICGRYFSTDSDFVARRTNSLGWVKIPFINISPGSPVFIAATDSLSAWVGANNGKLYYTTNAGFNWIVQIADSGNFAYINSVKFSRIHPNYGYVFCDPPNGSGTPFSVYKTTNGGVNWSLLNVFLGNNLVGNEKSMSVTDSVHVWLGLQNNIAGAKTAYTTNGGISWSLSTVFSGSNNITAIEFSHDNITGFSSPMSATNNIYKTTDGGLNWLFSSQNNFFVNTIVHIRNTPVWYYETLGDIFKSSNNGLNWSNTNAPLGTSTFEYLDAVKFGERIYCWAIRSDGGVIRLIDSTGIIGINSISNQIPNNYNLYQNYPNPFNPVTTIRYDVPANGVGDAYMRPVQIKIYDLLGREVFTYSDTKSPGSYEVQFDGSNLASGMYFYSLEATGFTDTKKMVLIK